MRRSDLSHQGWGLRSTTLCHMMIPRSDPSNSRAHRFTTRLASSTPGIWFMRNVGSRLDPTLVRLSRGRLSCVAPFHALVLTHTGARSGISRTSTVVYFTDRGRVIVIASNFGSAQNPSWYYNVKANPLVTLDGGCFRGRFVAEEITGTERDRLFGLVRGAASPYGHYQGIAGKRSIPVVAFIPAS